MNRRTATKDILQGALEAIHREAGLRMEVIALEAALDDKEVDAKRVDAIVQLPDNGAKLVVEVKKWANHANLGAVINQMRRIAEPGQGLFVADYINPNLGDKLKEAGIQFLDMAGNAYIHQHPIHIHVKGNKPPVTAPDRGKTGRAFQPTGLKLVFAFLTNPDLINAPYREIAEQAEVALGTVGWVLRDLVAEGFLQEGRHNKRRLEGFKQLLDKWAAAYPHTLRAKHQLGTFTTANDGWTTANNDWWRALAPQQLGAVWGGEIAAAEYTHYLNPKDGVVYIKAGHVPGFLKAARLRKVQPGEMPDIRIELFEPFWRETFRDEVKAKDQHNQDLAHPIIVYADLIATGDPRNLDAAQRLREKYID